MFSISHPMTSQFNQYIKKHTLALPPLIVHIVLFKMNDPSAGNIKKIIDALLRLKGRVPELLSIETGSDVVRSERSYDVALRAGFKDLDALKRYQLHPEHVRVAEMISRLCSSAVSVDCEKG